MKFIAYGMNHTTAPVELREKFALPPEKSLEVLQKIRSKAPEAVFLPTCNRVEFYLGTERVEESLRDIQSALGAFHRMKAPEIKKFFYLHEGTEAFLHLFRVASSLDSMVLGEAQILGQVKEAYQGAKGSGMTGAFLNGIFNRAFSAAKRVRTQTDIARMPTSVSSVAVDLAKKIFSPLSDHEVLLVGAGEMSELTAKYLVEAGVSRLFIANRTLEKAKALAAKLGGTPLSMETGLEKIGQVDIVLTSLGGGSLLRKADIERAMKSRQGRSLFIIDIGVPRNVEPGTGNLESVYLYNIDDLSSMADANRLERKKAVEAAETLLREEVKDLCAWLDTLELVPTVVRLRERFEKLRRAEWEEFLRKNPSLPEGQKRAVERLTKDLTVKLLHDPSVNLKGVENAIDRFEYARMLNEIFSLNEKPEGE